MKKFIAVIVLSFITCSLYAQHIPASKAYPQNDFRPPLDLPPSLSGSFGEIRSNHFHSGLDYRTNQREGYPVYAVADGFVSRLRVQNGGFGNAIYISHKNGYTSVYAHLQKFNDQIGRTVKDYQYRQQSFDVDFPLFPIEIPVKKGDIIAYSGNTGSSGGPHLHFEIRDSKTEEIINPQLFGLDIPDNVKPAINGFYVYRLNDLPFSESTPKQYFQVVGANGNYLLNKNPVINISGEVGFGIMTYDQSVFGGNHNGVYAIELRIDDKLVFESVLERFYFHNSRAVNSHIDYPALLTSGRKIQKSFVEPGNPLGIYKNSVNRGLIKLQDDAIHSAEYIVKDAKGNSSTLKFRIRQNSQAQIPVNPQKGIKMFFFNQANEFTTNDVKISFPPGALYSDINFSYLESAKNSRAFSKIHHIHTTLIPLHIPYTLWIRADSSLKESLSEKALIVDSRGISQGGTFEGGGVKTSARTFGSFYITVDTIPPVIRPVNVQDGKSFKDIDKMIFKISDNLSGIKSFNGTIDGQWVLMEYDPKTATLWHSFDDRTLPGKHLFQLVVTDMKGNSNSYTATIYR